MEFYTIYGFDEKLENDGVWMTLDPESEKPAKVLVGALNSERYQQAVFKLRQANLEALTANPDSDALAKSLMVEAMAETILLGWENVTFNGEELVYSKDNAMKLLQFRQFRETVMIFAMERENYRAKVAEADAKN